MIIKELQIEKITINGFGIGYYEEKTVFVFGGVKGDIVSAKVYHKKKDILFAHINSFVQKSKLRTENSNCKNHKICGGCIWLDINYENQLKLKQSCLEELFSKYKLEPIVASDSFFHYRNKCFLPISLDGTIGIYEKNSHNILDVSNCILQPKIFNELISETKNYILKSKIKIYNEKNHTGSLRFFGIRINEKKEILIILVSKNKIFKVSSNSFYQINSSQIENLYDYVKNNIAKNSKVIDAYSGVGTIGIYLANEQKKVYCIEENHFSTQNMMKNIEINSIDNIKIFQDKVENFLENFSNIDNFDCIIFDPPRKGLGKSIINKCINIPKIAYISCNPTTLLRDINLFEKIGFTVKKIKAFDMFPYTYHIENVAILEKN